MIGTKHVTENMGSFFERAVGKRSRGNEAEAPSDGGPSGSENPGLSNDKPG